MISHFLEIELTCSVYQWGVNCMPNRSGYMRNVSRTRAKTEQTMPGKYFCTMEKQIGKHITTSLQDCDTF